MDCSTPGFLVHHQLPELAQTHVHWVSDAIQPSHPLLSPLLLPSVFPSIRVFSSKSVLRIRWSKYWSFSFSISPSSEYSGLISLRMDWLDLLAIQGTLKSLLQHHSSKASILWHSAFFMVHLSYPYLTAGKNWSNNHWKSELRNFFELRGMLETSWNYGFHTFFFENLRPSKTLCEHSTKNQTSKQANKQKITYF